MMMKKVVRLIGAIGACTVIFRGIIGISDDICKFIDKRKEAKNHADSVDECVSGTVTPD